MLQPNDKSTTTKTSFSAVKFSSTNSGTHFWQYALVSMHTVSSGPMKSALILGFTSVNIFFRFSLRKYLRRSETRFVFFSCKPTSNVVNVRHLFACINFYATSNTIMTTTILHKRNCMKINQVRVTCRRASDGLTNNSNGAPFILYSSNSHRFCSSKLLKYCTTSGVNWLKSCKKIFTRRIWFEQEVKKKNNRPQKKPAYRSTEDLHTRANVVEPQGCVEKLWPSFVRIL